VRPLPSLRRAGRSQAGFTLVELLIVVAILGLLASLATVGYRRYVGRARLTEAVTLLAEMTSKEQIYFLEFGGYLPLRGDNVTALPSANEGAAGFYPSNPTSSTFESSRTAVTISNPAAWPGGWRSVGLRPREPALYCTYMLNAGGTGHLLPAGSTFAPSLLGTLTATTPPWFYALAVCNLTGAAGYPTGGTVLGVSSNRSALRTFNDGQ
jgi:prepilin-type N-terminal cleavage/methylation domain-containing protein